MKRGQGEGTIRYRADGRWEARVSITLEDGCVRRRSMYARTKTEARERMQQLLREVARGLPAPDERMTVETYLRQWLRDVEGSVRPLTVAAYRRWLLLHVVPVIGGRPLARLTPRDVQAMLARKRADGLSPRSVAHIRTVLRTALQRAVRWGVVGRNVAALADPPRVPAREVEAMTPQEATAILGAVAGTRIAGLVTLALYTGLRSGEALGLRWADVDLEARALRVHVALQRRDGTFVLVEPKTVRSRRTLGLPGPAVEALRAQRARQAEMRLAAGSVWQEMVPDLVFTTATGSPFHGPTVTHELQAALARGGLRPRRFHDLRHGCATLLLASGTDIAVVRDILGHSTIGLTADTYARVLPSLQREAVARLETLMSSGRPTRA